jgi:hypothetical protein
MVVAPYAATVWTDIAIPLLLAFIGGAIAIFWPWLQSFFRGRKFQGIIRRELAEVGPHPPCPKEGKPWWEHLTKRFVHEEVFARERLSENRDFLLSLDPTVVYLVSQLWISFAKRDGGQWLHYVGELAEDPRVGSEDLKRAHRDWQAVMDAQPNELKTLPRVREDASRSMAIEVEQGLFEARLNSYRSLLHLTSVQSPSTGTLSPDERRDRAKELTEWFYSGGGLLLSGDALNVFLVARSRLEDERSTDDVLRAAMSALRTELKIDLGVRHSDERHVPMSQSLDQRAWH